MKINKLISLSTLALCTVAVASSQPVLGAYKYHHGIEIPLRHASIIDDTGSIEKGALIEQVLIKLEQRDVQVYQDDEGNLVDDEGNAIKKDDGTEITVPRWIIRGAQDEINQNRVQQLPINGVTLAQTDLEVADVPDGAVFHNPSEPLGGPVIHRFIFSDTLTSDDLRNHLPDIRSVEREAQTYANLKIEYINELSDTTLYTVEGNEDFNSGGLTAAVDKKGVEDEDHQVPWGPGYDKDIESLASIISGLDKNDIRDFEPLIKLEKMHERRQNPPTQLVVRGFMNPWLVGKTLFRIERTYDTIHLISSRGNIDIDTRDSGITDKTTKIVAGTNYQGEVSWTSSKTQLIIHSGARVSFGHKAGKSNTVERLVVSITTEHDNEKVFKPVKDDDSGNEIAEYIKTVKEDVTGELRFLNSAQGLIVTDFPDPDHVPQQIEDRDDEDDVVPRKNGVFLYSLAGLSVQDGDAGDLITYTGEGRIVLKIEDAPHYHSSNGGFFYISNDGKIVKYLKDPWFSYSITDGSGYLTFLNSLTAPHHFTPELISFLNDAPVYKIKGLEGENDVLFSGNFDSFAANADSLQDIIAALVSQDIDNFTHFETIIEITGDISPQLIIQGFAGVAVDQTLLKASFATPEIGTAELEVSESNGNLHLTADDELNVTLGVESSTVVSRNSIQFFGNKLSLNRLGVAGITKIELVGTEEFMNEFNNVNFELVFNKGDEPTQESELQWSDNTDNSAPLNFGEVGRLVIGQGVTLTIAGSSIWHETAQISFVIADNSNKLVFSHSSAPEITLAQIGIMVEPGTAVPQVGYKHKLISLTDANASFTSSDPRSFTSRIWGNLQLSFSADKKAIHLEKLTGGVPKTVNAKEAVRSVAIFDSVPDVVDFTSFDSSDKKRTTGRNANRSSLILSSRISDDLTTGITAVSKLSWATTNVAENATKVFSGTHSITAALRYQQFSGSLAVYYAHLKQSETVNHLVGTNLRFDWLTPVENLSVGGYVGGLFSVDQDTIKTMISGITMNYAYTFAEVVNIHLKPSVKLEILPDFVKVGESNKVNLSLRAHFAVDLGFDTADLLSSNYRLGVSLPIQGGLGGRIYADENFVNAYTWHFNTGLNIFMTIHEQFNVVAGYEFKYTSDLIAHGVKISVNVNI